MLAVGTSLGPYKILSLLGAGGTGGVCPGRQPRTAPTLPSSNAPFGPKAISTVCSL
jgi:hypothetical protein